MNKTYHLNFYTNYVHDINININLINWYIIHWIVMTNNADSVLKMKYLLNITSL